MGYLDDIIIYSRSEKEHLELLEEIFIRLKAAGLNSSWKNVVSSRNTYSTSDI